MGTFLEVPLSKGSSVKIYLLADVDIVFYLKITSVKQTWVKNKSARQFQTGTHTEKPNTDYLI